MSPDHDPLQPTPFEPAAPTSTERPQGSTAPERTQSGPPGWALPALGGLLLLAVLVVFWLPNLVAPGDAPSDPAPTATGAPVADNPTETGGQSPPPPDASPWADAQQAKLRKEAQDVLAELLELQFELQERGVEQWAGEAFAAATAQAAAGDELYKERQYEQATAQFSQGIATLEAIRADIPRLMDEQLERARQAIEDGETAEALAALEMARLIEPENAEIDALSQRAAALETLLPLLAQAAEAEQAGDLATAERLLGEAAGVDPDHLRTRSELKRVASAHKNQRFNDAMSDGYAALDEGKFSSAREHFKRAQSLDDSPAEASSALQEVAAAETAFRLAGLKQQGSRHEQSENWQDAVDAYRKAQKIDGNVTFAQRGLQRSIVRAELDKQFRQALQEPERLSDVAVAEALQQRVKEGEQIQPRGPVLERQLTQLRTLLVQANKPIAVTLRSDTETEVIVYKVARLGRFDQRQLTLRPGKYTAVGTRNGYRDVRQDFVINHNATPPPITIACTEPI